MQAQAKSATGNRTWDQGLTSEINLKTTTAIADELAETLFDRKEEGGRVSGSRIEAQLAAQRVQIEKLRRRLAIARRQQVVELTVRAGAEGVLQEMPVAGRASASCRGRCWRRSPSLAS